MKKHPKLCNKKIQIIRMKNVTTYNTFYAFITIAIIVFNIIGVSAWMLPRIKGNIDNHNYFKNTDPFTYKCTQRFVPIQSNFLFQKYNDTTLDFLNSFIAEYSFNTNPETIEQLEFTFNCFNGFHIKRACPPLTPYITEHKEQFKKELPSIKQEFHPLSEHLEEVFYFAHGLRFADQRIKDFVRQRDILDIGAYIGDSAAILAKYTDKKIYSYELSPKNIKKIYDVAKVLKISDKVVPVNAGISDKPGTSKINDVAHAGGSLSRHGTVLINLTTVDAEVERTGSNPGFIKADVEGFGLNVIKGAEKTIKKFRPVIEIAVYHCYDELFLIPKFLKRFPNYLFDFHSENDNYDSMGELAIFAYPAELLYPTGDLNDESKL